MSRRALIISLACILALALLGHGAYVVLADAPPPPVPTDLWDEPVIVPDEENGYFAYMRAEALLDADGIFTHQPTSAVEALQVLWRHRAAVSDLDEALSRPYRVVPRPEMWGSLTTTGASEAGSLLVARARLLALTGCSRLAAGTCIQLARLGHDLGARNVGTIDRMIADRLKKEGLEELRQMIRLGVIPPSALLMVQSQLLGLQTSREIEERVLRQQARFEWDSLEEHVRGGGAREWGAKPNETLSVLMDLYRENIEACLLPEGSGSDSPKVVSDPLVLVDPSWYVRFRPNGLGEQYAQYSSMAPRYLIATIRLEERATLILIALTRYRHEHGTAPERLADLVPIYLEAVPLDPFVGQPLEYDPTFQVIRAAGGEHVIELAPLEHGNLFDYR